MIKKVPTLLPLSIITAVSPVVLAIVILLVSCHDNEPKKNEEENPINKITIDPATTYQEMLGFGGALSWYSDRIINSPKKNEITNLIFNDLGMDILRVKNWYYPDNYPAVKTTTTMSDDNSTALWTVTNQLHEIAKQNNPNLKVLFSSWGPPAGLKSNGSTRQGTLKKNANGTYMYDEFATYWGDLLDRLPFNPEYISIQNEPSYVNAGWTTSQWDAVETTQLPGYNTAFDKVYDVIKSRTNPPVMIGPESANIAGTTFSGYAETLRNRPHLGMYAWHPYNFGPGTNPAQTRSALEAVAAFSNKPNIMSEYSDTFDWFNTAIFINNTLVYANTSAYIYWKLAWAEPAAGAANAGMVSIASSGEYSVTPFYHVIKHFAKEIDAGFKRIKVGTIKNELHASAFINPAQDKITLILVNNGTQAVMDLEVVSKNISSLSGHQSVEGDYYKPLLPANTVTIPAKSITTVVLTID